jgi:hypothetical protein
MPARHPRLVALAAAALTAAAHAQPKPLLDLGAAPQAPAAGQGAGALALADDLRKQADDLSRSGSDRDRARGACRRFIQTLLTSGEAMGPGGSGRIVIARTLARGLPDIDRLITASEGPLGDAQAALLARDVESAARRLDEHADPWRATRDAFALLTRTLSAAPNSGWVDQDPQPDAALDIDAWARAGLSDSSVATLKDLDTLTAGALRWPPYQASALHIRRALREAANLLTAPPPWLPDPARRAAAAQFEAAAAALTDEAHAPGALASLRRMATLETLGARLSVLEDSPAIKRTRTEFAKAVEIAPPDPTTQASRLAAFDHTLDLVHPTFPDERTLVRQARPAWRVLQTSLKPTELKLTQVLPDVLSRDDALTDPGVAAAVAAHRRTIQDLQALAALNAAMVEPGAGEPSVTGPWKLAADRLFKLGQDMGKPSTHDESLTNLRDLATQTQEFMLLPGEIALRDAAKSTDKSSSWAVLTGDRAQPLLSEVSDRRGTWLSGWDKAGYAGAPAEVQRLRTLRDLMTILDAASMLIPAGSDAATPFASLNAWPGVELSPDALAALIAGLADKTAEATRLITGGDAGACAKALDQIRPAFAAALLIGHLAREAADRKISPETPVLLEIGSGGPVEGLTWRADAAARLAAICRYAEEVPIARKLGARDRAESLLKYVNARAAE